MVGVLSARVPRVRPGLRSRDSRMVCRTNVFHHRHRAADAMPLNMEFVHECTRQIDAAAGALEQRLLRKRVRKAIGIEAVTLIGDNDPELLLSPGDRHHDFFVYVAPVAVDDCIGHNLVDGEANMLQSDLPESGPSGHLERVAFGAVCALQSRIQDPSCCFWYQARRFARWIA